MQKKTKIKIDNTLVPPLNNGTLIQFGHYQYSCNQCNNMKGISLALLKELQIDEELPKFNEIKSVKLIEEELLELLQKHDDYKLLWLWIRDNLFKGRRSVFNKFYTHWAIVTNASKQIKLKSRNIGRINYDKFMSRRQLRGALKEYENIDTDIEIIEDKPGQRKFR